MSSTKRGIAYFENLDSIRFIAALMVFLHHIANSLSRKSEWQSTFWGRFFNVIANGETGVSIFFVLSGFLITYLLVVEAHTYGKINLGTFYLRRILRIWPLYFTVIVFSFGLLPWFRVWIGTPHKVCSDLNYYLGFLGNFDVLSIEKFHPGCDELSQTITWSVAIEEQFYLFWPLIFILPKRFWMLIVALIALFSIGFRLMNHDDYLVLYFHTFSVLIDLTVGGLLALLVLHSTKVKSFFENCGTKMHLLFWGLSFSLLFWHFSWFGFAYGNALSRIFTALCFAMIIGAQAITKSSSVLNLKRFTFAKTWGKYTYGIYLLHPLAIVILEMARFQWSIFQSGIVFAITAFILTLILSKLSYHYLERPFLQWKNKISRSAQPN